MNHVYTTNGVYSAVLTVTDGRGGSDSVSLSISVGNRRPVVSIASPLDGATYAVGDTIALQGSANDPDEGALAAGAFTWRTTLYHNTHTHPFQTDTGTPASLNIPDHGDGTYFVVTLEATDTAGLKGSSSVTIRPQTVQFTLDSAASGRNLVYDGVLVQAPFVATTVAKSSHSIGAPSPQGSFVFRSWSDGGAAQHDVTLGIVNESRTATFAAASLISFNDLTNPDRTLTGQYPSGVVNWGSNIWYLSGPWGAFATNSVSFLSPSQTSGAFTFITPRVLLAFQAYNGGGATSTVTASCAGNTTVSQVIQIGELLTVPTNWAVACAAVTMTSSNGWNTNFDDFTHDSVAATDTTPPAISNVQATGVTETAATVTWTTDEASSTQVEFGTTTGYGTSVPASPNTNPITSHSQPVTNLSPATLYHYRVRSVDAAGNGAVSGDFTFTTSAPDTTPPQVTAIQANNVTETAATITWTTNEPSSTQVDYGATAAYGSSSPPVPDTTPVTSHSRALTGLAPGSIYHYRVRSTDVAGNMAVSGDFTFTTVAQDATPPQISGVLVTGITQTAATVSWTTNEPSSTQVEYGASTAYGALAPASPNTTPITSHSQGLTGLTPATLYHYRVRSRDSAGNEAISPDFTFTTAADTTAPTISGVQASGVSQTTATMSWATNEPGTSQVEYGTTISYGLSAPATPSGALVTSHSQPLTGLAPGTLYHFRVRSVDAASNIAVSSDFTFVTASQAGGAWRFDGSNDRATATDSNSLDLAGPLTLEAWVKFDSVQTGKWHTILFKQGTSNNLAYSLYYHNGIWFELRLGTQYVVLEDLIPLQTGRWYHVAGVYDGTTMKTFVDGQQSASRAASGAVLQSAYNVTLGYNNVWSNEQLSGTLDEARISNIARYPANFTPAGVFTPDANTRALWHFDEGSGQTTTDASGNGNTLRRGVNLNAESSDPGWVAGAPLILAGLGFRRRRLWSGRKG